MKMKSHSMMLNYINLLLHDDNELRKFVVDPITNSEEHSLTKAERAVLRRAVAGLSNNAKNGYSIDRALSSYRRSLRLVQNVLNNVASNSILDLMPAPSGQYAFQLQVYYPTVKQNTDFTKHTNSDVDKDSGPYANHTAIYTVYMNTPKPSVKAVMDQVNTKYNNIIPYSTVANTQGAIFVDSFTLGGFKISADLTQYSLKDDYVFWFYTVNGTPSKGGTPHAGGSNGSLGQSFADKTLDPNDIVYWQLIAPDSRYGFAHCYSHPMNKYAKKLEKVELV